MNVENADKQRGLIKLNLYDVSDIMGTKGIIITVLLVGVIFALLIYLGNIKLEEKEKRTE